jgi:ECF sigma factor
MKVIELRFFGGLSVEETAELLKIPPQSVMRDWKLAKAWLQRELRRKHQAVVLAEVAALGTPMRRSRSSKRGSPWSLSNIGWLAIYTREAARS